MHGVIDPFDLAAWPIEEEPQRIYGDAALTLWALVSPEDYSWACRHPWSVLRRPGRGVYLRRNAELHVTWCPTSGIVIRGVQTTLYLHVEIMKRTGVPPPSEKHVLVDHRTLDTLDCQRHNLRWATYAMNNARDRRLRRQRMRKKGQGKYYCLLTSNPQRHFIRMSLDACLTAPCMYDPMDTPSKRDRKTTRRQIRNGRTLKCLTRE